MKRPSILFQVLLTFVVAAPAHAAKPSAVSKAEAAKVDRLQKEIDALRSEIIEMKATQEEFYFDASESAGTARSFFSDRLTFGGFFETGLTSIWGPDTTAQTAPASNTFGLNISASFSRDLKFVGQLLTSLAFPLQNPDNDADAPSLGLPISRRFEGFSAVSLPAQAYVEYAPGDTFYLQGGLGYVPFGYALQQRELVLFVRRGGPQLMRMQELVEPLWAGVNFGGESARRWGRVGFNLYTFPYLEQVRSVGVGGRVYWESLEERVRFGVSAQAGNTRTGGAQTTGSDLRIRLGPFTVLSEYARRFTDPGDPWNLYVEPNYTLTPRFIIYAFADYAENPLNRTVVGATALADPWTKFEYGGGLNWLPTPFTRFRVGFFAFDYRGASAEEHGRDRDLRALDFSAGVAF